MHESREVGGLFQRFKLSDATTSDACAARLAVVSMAWRGIRGAYGLCALVMALLLSLSLSAACGYWAPVPRSARDVDRLPATQEDVRARWLGDEDIPALARLHSLRDVNFSDGWRATDARLTDKGLYALTSLRLPSLDHLALGYCPHITDAGLERLGNFRRLRILSLMGSGQITDRGLQSLVEIDSLRILDLRGCSAITDAGLRLLAKKTNLQRVMLGGCQHISQTAVDSLQRALPNARIDKDDEEWALHKPK
jgi:hypothetical protein